MLARCLIILGCLLLVSHECSGDEQKTDLDRIQGAWQGTKRESKGKVTTTGADKAKYVFKDDQLTIFDGDKDVSKVTFTLDPARAFPESVFTPELRNTNLH